MSSSYRGPLAHAAVVPAVEDGAEGVILAELVRAALAASGRYHVVSTCDDCVATAADKGLDLVVRVERVDASTVGLRVLDVASGLETRDVLAYAAAPGPASLEEEPLAGLFFLPGAIAVSGAPAGAEVLLDGRPLAVVGDARFDGLAAGKHTVVLSAEGYVPEFAAVLVHPGATAAVDWAPVPAAARSKARTSLLVGLGLGAVGALGVIATAGGPVPARTP